MSAERMRALAAALSDALNISVYPEPGAPGRSGIYGFCEPPTLLLDAATQTFCARSGSPRLSTSFVIVGAGTSAGQLLALYDAVTAAVIACDEVPGWSPSGDTQPATYADTPAYTIPLTSR